MTNPRIKKQSSKVAKQESTLLIQGAKYIPDEFKKDLIPLRDRVREDIVLNLLKIKHYLTTGNGNRSELIKNCNTLIDLIKTKEVPNGRTNAISGKSLRPEDTRIGGMENRKIGRKRNS